jgi:hypothetical protein
MRRSDFVKVGTIGAAALLMATAFLTGCQQQQSAQPTNEKQARLLAAQSADLQRQLAARDAEIASLRTRHAQDIKLRDAELARCRARIQVLERDVEKGIAERVSGVTATVMNENAELRKEIERLQAEIEELKKAAGTRQQL